MTVEEAERQQQRVLPKDDLSPYAGQWVALRNGRVIASDVSGVALRDNAEVREDDMLVPVPPSPAGVFIL